MSLPQMSPDGAGRPRWLKIAAGVWLVLVSAIAIVDSVGLSRLIEQSRSSAQDAQVQALATRVSDLEHQAEAAKRQPKPVVQGTSTLPARRWRSGWRTSNRRRRRMPTATTSRRCRRAWASSKRA
jgi:hypothetical protein